MRGDALLEEFRPSHGTVRFGIFELDADAGELRKQGTRMKLQEQPDLFEYWKRHVPTNLQEIQRIR